MTASSEIRINFGRVATHYESTSVCSGAFDKNIFLGSLPQIKHSNTNKQTREELPPNVRAETRATRRMTGVPKQNTQESTKQKHSLNTPLFPNQFFFEGGPTFPATFRWSPLRAPRSGASPCPTPLAAAAGPQAKRRFIPRRPTPSSSVPKKVRRFMPGFPDSRNSRANQVALFWLLSWENSQWVSKLHKVQMREKP